MVIIVIEKHQKKKLFKLNPFFRSLNFESPSLLEEMLVLTAYLRHLQ